MKKRKHKKKEKNLFLVILIALILFVLIILLEKNSNIILHDGDLYNENNFNKENMFYSYEDENYTSIIGIDVSEHNDKIDWQKVKESGIEFAFIRIGWRGYTEGNIYIDSNFYENYQNAKENNIKVGVYFFSQALNTTEAKEEAEFILKTLDGLTLDLPIVYDFENIDKEKARSDSIDKETLTNNALTFFNILENKYDVMLYANNNLINNYYNMEKLSNYKLWYAQYHDKPQSAYNFTIWQYSENGIVDGINKKTDLNIMFIKK